MTNIPTSKLVVAKIDRDYQELGCVGINWTADEVNAYHEYEPIDFREVPTARFRALDDDEIPYLGGWLLNDDWCAVQDAILSWAMRDSGCTIIEVKENNEWKREIG